MLFNSFEYILFLPLVFAAYFVLPHRFRWMLLLAASYYFYACWKAEYLLLIFISTLCCYSFALLISKTEEPARRKILLVIALCINLGMLFAYKYLNFFSAELNSFLAHFTVNMNTPTFRILLPVGISFYTFQSTGYVIDVFRRKVPPERHFGIFALYVSFFPQLVAGPIERAGRLIPQFLRKAEPDPERIASGLRLILWGFFKKVVIADKLAIFVDRIYNHPTEYTGLPLLVATFFFYFQIYCDFSGYTDIARGSARLLGFDLMVNFRTPFFSKSYPEFWRRWHISMASWFRDYVFFPLGGSRVPKWRWYVNLLILFFVIGFWHGASWTFILWGFQCGLYILISIWTTGIREKISSVMPFPRMKPLGDAFKILFLYNITCTTRIIFRSNSMSDAWYIFTHLFSGYDGGNLFSAEFGPEKFIAGIVSVVFLLVVEWFQYTGRLNRTFFSLPAWARWGSYYLVILWILSMGEFGHRQFYYFQF